MAVVPKQNGLNILRKLVPLNTLTEETLEELMAEVQFEKIAKGNYLFRAGDTETERVYLLSGKVSLLEDGKEVDAISASSNMARYPIAHHIPRRFSARALTKAEIVRIDSHLLSDLLTRGGNVLYQVEELNGDSDDDWMSQLLQSPIFQRIPAANIQNIMMRMEEVQVSAGEMIICQGEPGDYFYLINRGQCSVTRERGDGEIEELAQLGAGNCLGEESLLSGKPRGSTVSMLTDGVLFRLEKKDFIEYIKMPLANAISYGEAMRRVEKGAVWLDVRSPLEHQRMHVKKSRNIPFNELRSELAGLDVDTTYIVYCQDGLVSSTAVYLLMEQGLDALVLERGLEAVPEEALKRDRSKDGAEIIKLRQDQEETLGGAAVVAPDDEAGLLRERLQKTELQAQEQLQRARKLKLMLEKLKGRLAESEAGETRASEESQRLAEEVKKLQAQLKAQEKSGASLKQQQSAIERQLAEVTQEKGQLQDQLDQVVQEIGKLEKRLETKQQEASQLKTAQLETRDELQRELDASREELERLREEKRAQEQNADQLQAKLEKVAAELEQRAAALKQAEQSIADAQKKQQEAEQQQASQLAARDALQQELDASRAELERLRKEQETQGQSAGQLQTQLAEVQAELEQRNAALKQAEQSIAEAQKKQQEAEQQQASQSAARDALQQELDASRAELEQLRKEQETQGQSAGQLQTQLETLRTELAQRSSALNEAEQLLAEARKREQEVDQQLAERDTLQQELEQRRTELERLREETRTQEQTAEKLQLALDTAERQKQLHQEELAQLRSELEAANVRLVELEREKAALQEERQQRQTEQEANLQHALDQALAKHGQLESSLRISTDERDRLAAELTVLQKSFGQLQQLADERENDLVELRLQIEREKRSGVEEGQTFEQLKAELKQLTEALETANTELDATRQEAEEKQQLLNELQQLLDSERASAETVKSQLQASEQALQALQQEREQQADDLDKLNGERNRLQALLEEAQQRVTELEAQLAAPADSSELDSLRDELAEANAARMAAETAVQQAGKSAAAKVPQSQEIKAIQAELETLNDALDEADRAYEALEQEKTDLQKELEQLRSTSSDSADSKALIAAKEAAEQEVARLCKEMEELRQQVAESAANESSLAQVAELQTSLEQANLRLKELELGSSADAAECEVLRQDIDKLKRSLDERSAELEQARKQSLLLEEKTEERNSEIDRLKLALEAAQVEAEEAAFKKDEAVAARKQVEESLYLLQKQVEHARPRDDLLEKRAANGPAAPSGGAAKQKLTALLVGALLAFGAAEALSILGGNGEIIGGFLGQGRGQTIATVTPLPEPVVASAPVQADLTVDQPAAAASAPVNPVQPAVPQAEAPKPTPVEQPQPRIALTPPEPAKPEPVPPKVEPRRGPETGTQMQDQLSAGGMGPELVYIRGGSFMMGSPMSQLANEEQPVHEVTLKNFSIGRYEVTFRDYELFAAATDRPLPDDLGWGQGPRPVINVSWEDARAYTQWLSEQTGQRYRLPTEAEWEYAASAGTESPYWWGSELGTGNANCFNCGSRWDGSSTAPVGRFKPNPFGLYNTAGNVMEWVEDCYHSSYDGAPTDGSSWQEPGCTERVVRGGAFNKPGESLRVTRRGRHDPDARLLVVGFRVVREER
ncbi:SUMF1/EgtB/PvdO family nonheme iron enzyme [Sedimenticola thiotaurini]|uniref:SUMF1/EgtB/PvdO family nonheme iron enzyme n=1 Tax=Sedimenticola thiotaurini TaxID=1543721 RepID=UPI00069A6458|nr:SUMF1/EgtB/PvdO family nonheme iron enzyme [Sedimenticola thiotaurini]